jgi:hypothetical protein
MTETIEITNEEDVIDSRDIVDRIGYLESFEESELDEYEKEELNIGNMEVHYFAILILLNMQKNW